MGLLKIVFQILQSTKWRSLNKEASGGNGQILIDIFFCDLGTRMLLETHTISIEINISSLTSYFKCYQKVIIFVANERQIL